MQLHIVSLFTREWIEIESAPHSRYLTIRLPLYEGVDWNKPQKGMCLDLQRSPSLRGSGLKFGVKPEEWEPLDVSLFTREWIEIMVENVGLMGVQCLPLYEGVDWNSPRLFEAFAKCNVSLFTREWIEISDLQGLRLHQLSLPLYEGVDWNSFSCSSNSTVCVSPSLRGSGLKLLWRTFKLGINKVSLFTREWIEIL